MRKTTLIRLLALVLLAIALFNFGLVPTALAGDTANGAKIFKANCAACHIRGGNIIIAHKTLKQPALEKYNMKSIEAIVSQVQNGKNAMPSFKGRLTCQQSEDVAAYVLEKSEAGW